MDQAKYCRCIFFVAVHRRGSTKPAEKRETAKRYLRRADSIKQTTRRRRPPSAMPRGTTISKIQGADSIKQTQGTADRQAPYQGAQPFRRSKAPSIKQNTKAPIEKSTRSRQTAKQAKAPTIDRTKGRRMNYKQIKAPTVKLTMKLQRTQQRPALGRRCCCYAPLPSAYLGVGTVCPCC
uniref:Uncharacterized protein n=1 Tax=Odontella aurita TaxID=265563 RepID=A0A7S4N801_9STRA